MQKQLMQITKKKDIALDTVEMVLANKYISKYAVPGQFLHLLVPGQMLRRPISIADVDKESETVTIIFKILGAGTKQLATCQVGEAIDALGPNGNGFPLDMKRDSTAVLIGGGIGVPPLYYLAKKLHEQEVNLFAVLGFQTKVHVFYEEKFQQLAQTIIVTNDGSYGKTGLVTDVLDNFTKPINRYYTCGPMPMLSAVKRQLVNVEGYISLEERMGCGVGACFACVIPTDHQGGYKKICQDGPVFSAKEVQLQ
ncbi:dihydroorotate dehydrogenase electron transfer subunit [Virgibacillus proomii]|uniref:dihydroorotate dehydrogenase electron transfer subunit n=1 Tax=Virgibacillus proomii TaxID=84407 RepID=UPI0028168F9A|nr:dihydroorotate dehydrogenase electron transfer subunit [Virgibacillus proomii]